jgi:hypothetical protein
LPRESSRPLKIDLELIKQRLFSDPRVRHQILRDYGFKVQPQDAGAMAAELVARLEQSPVDDPLKQNSSSAEVFRAAVMALSSISRAWATFRKTEHNLSDLLRGYDPVRTHNAFERRDLSIDHIKVCLPGQSSSADAVAIRRWARLLTEVDDYYGYVRGLGSFFRQRAQDCFGTALPVVASRRRDEPRVLGERSGQVLAGCCAPRPQVVGHRG